MRVFLGMTNYQENFIEGYSKVTLSLTNLLNKDKRWIWIGKCHTTFEDLKKMMVTTPILNLPDYDIRFEVHTDS